jgi:hypothetical protein
LLTRLATDLIEGGSILEYAHDTILLLEDDLEQAESHPMFRGGLRERERERVVLKESLLVSLDYYL